MASQTATFGAGCFWCLEAAMNQLNGVTQALSGYMGGAEKMPIITEYALAIPGMLKWCGVEFDDEVIDFEQLCLIFLACTAPTQLNRQGNDVGTQYRSVIFYHTEQQHNLALRLISELAAQQVFNGDIVTEVSQVSRFFIAEAYHQQYFIQHPEQGYCQFIVAPKMAKFRQRYQAFLKP